MLNVRSHSSRLLVTMPPPPLIRRWGVKEVRWSDPINPHSKDNLCNFGGGQKRIGPRVHGVVCRARKSAVNRGVSLRASFLAGHRVIHRADWCELAIDAEPMVSNPSPSSGESVANCQGCRPPRVVAP